MSIGTHQALSQMKLTELADLCSDELHLRSSSEPTDGRYSLELLRRATVEQADQAWSLVQQCLSEPIRAWIRSHPYSDVALRHDSEEDLIAQTFSRFWYAVHEQQLEFTRLSAALSYLRATLNGTLIDVVRSHLRMQVREVSLAEPGCSAEPTPGEPTDGPNLWKSIESLLADERERRIVYLLYFCGLKPREIVSRCAEEFGDVKEIYRLNHNIIERLRRQRDQVRHLFASNR
jgi:DNA-directed RNA polymerase specialized sigma24 family protein